VENKCRIDNCPTTHGTLESLVRCLHPFPTAGGSGADNANDGAALNVGNNYKMLSVGPPNQDEAHHRQIGAASGQPTPRRLSSLIEQIHAGAFELLCTGEANR